LSSQSTSSAFHELRALADEFVAAAGERIVDGSGDGEDLAAGVAGEPGGDQRARFLAASTTSVPCDRPAMMRLRRGKVAAAAAVPGGNSETTAPLAAIALGQLRCCARIDPSSPHAQHRDGEPSASSAPSWQAASMPERQAAGDT
jgi:hypothetical protein